MKLIEQNKFHSFADIRTFWNRRWLRTLPMYFVALIAFLQLDYRGKHDFFEFPMYFVFMQNFASNIPAFFELSWSLAIEEHFYLWFPLAFLIWKKITKRTYLAIILTALTFIVVAYVFRLNQPIFTDWNAYNGTIRMTVLSRMDAIMFGVIMAATKFYWPVGFSLIKRGTPITATLFVLLCCWWFAGIPHLMQSSLMQINLFTVQAVLCSLLLPWFDGFHSTSDRKNDFFVLTSKLSYSLYLVHILVIVAVNKTLGYLGIFEQVYKNPFILYPIYFSLFYFISWCTYHQIEKPFLMLRDLPLTFYNVLKSSSVAVLISITIIWIF